MCTKCPPFVEKIVRHENKKKGVGCRAGRAPHLEWVGSKNSPGSSSWKLDIFPFTHPIPRGGRKNRGKIGEEAKNKHEGGRDRREDFTALRPRLGTDSSMASRILANLIVAGGSALLRAASQAYRQAIVNAQRTGVAQEAANGAAAKTMWGKKVMTVEEARQVLGVDASATYSEVYARYEKLFESNEKGGSFYLQSKIYRAREALDGEYDEATVKAEREAAEARANGTQKKVDDGAGGEKEGSSA